MNPETDNNTQMTPESQQPSPQYGSSPTGSPAPKNNKAVLWISVVVAVLVVIGVVVFFMNRSGDKKEDSNNKTTTTSSNNKSDSSDNNSASTNSKFEKYDVKDPLGDYSVSFYKGATTLDKNSLHYLISGTQGSQISTYLSLGSAGELDCQGAPSTTMNIAGQSIKVCYQPDNKVYSGQLSVKGVSTRVNVAGQKSVSMEDAKAILESFSFK